MPPVTRPLVHFQIRGRDPERLRDFYARIFAWDMSDPSPVGIINFPAGIGGPEEGVGGSIMRDEVARVIPYIQVLDPLETMALAESLGGRRVMEPFDVPGGPTVAQIADPEGNVIGLVKQ
jgi:predicted enzyme related to lactoylglutathione lyase